MRSMQIPPYKKMLPWVAAAMALCLIPMIAYLWRTDDLEKFCSSVPRDATVEQIQEFAKKSGLNPILERDMKIRIVMPGISLHTPNCTVHFNYKLKVEAVQYMPP
jgi:hypothetical protein